MTTFLNIDAPPAPSDFELEVLDRDAWARRYWEKVDVRGEDECWLWQAATNNVGYGLFRVNGILSTAHRLAWTLANGPIPESLCVLHHCDNRACVNIGHLFLGTVADNQRDMVEKGRSTRGARHGMHKLTREKVREIRRLYATGKHLQRELGERFGVTESQVGRIVRREGWAWLE